MLGVQLHFQYLLYCIINHQCQYCNSVNFNKLWHRLRPSNDTFAASPTIFANNSPSSQSAVDL